MSFSSGRFSIVRGTESMPTLSAQCDANRSGRPQNRWIVAVECDALRGADVSVGFQIELSPELLD
jgi:hypothetical protein